MIPVWKKRFLYQFPKNHKENVLKTYVDKTNQETIYTDMEKTVEYRNTKLNFSWHGKTFREPQKIKMLHNVL